MSRRSALLELAILGLLHDAPMHGYELRKQLNAVLGAFRALSYGTLYPCLRDQVALGWIAEHPENAAPAGQVGARAGVTAAGSRRARIVYKLTPEGKEHLQSLLAQSGPSSWEDDTFTVHFALFARTEADVRLRILEGRRSRLEERLDAFRSAAAQRRQRLDLYTAELQRHGLDSVEREVRWLSELIETERSSTPAAAQLSAPTPGASTPGAPTPGAPTPGASTPEVAPRDASSHGAPTT